MHLIILFTFVPVTILCMFFIVILFYISNENNNTKKENASNRKNIPKNRKTQPPIIVARYARIALYAELLSNYEFYF